MHSTVSFVRLDDGIKTEVCNVVELTSTPFLSFFPPLLCFSNPSFQWPFSEPLCFSLFLHWFSPYSCCYCTVCVFALICVFSLCSEQAEETWRLTRQSASRKSRTRQLIWYIYAYAYIPFYFFLSFFLPVFCGNSVTAMCFCFSNFQQKNLKKVSFFLLFFFLSFPSHVSFGSWNFLMISSHLSYLVSQFARIICFSLVFLGRIGLTRLNSKMFFDVLCNFFFPLPIRFIEEKTKESDLQRALSLCEVTYTWFPKGTVADSKSNPPYRGWYFFIFPSIVPHQKRLNFM